MGIRFKIKARQSLRLIRSISIIVPAYNEQARLPETIWRIQRYLSGSEWIFHEIVIVDDGSTDGTVAVASAFVKRIRMCGCCGILAIAVKGIRCGTGCWRLAASGAVYRCGFIGAD